MIFARAQRLWGLVAAVMATLMAGILMAAPIHAQVAVSAAMESDYRFRGLSLSHGQPDIRLGLSWDHSSGAYAGLSLIGAGGKAAWGHDKGVRLLGYVDYAGYILRPKRGPAWDVGITNMHVHNSLQGSFSYDFSEVYAGVVGDHVSFRLSYAPSYFGRPWRTVYADLSGGKRLSPHWRAFAHAGMLTPLSGRFRGQRYDLSAGVAVSVRTYDVRMAWTRSNPVPSYPGQYVYEGDGLLVTAAAYF